MRPRYRLGKWNVKTGPISCDFSVKKTWARSRPRIKGNEPINGTDGNPRGKFPAGLFLLIRNLRKAWINRKVPKNTATVGQNPRDKTNSRGNIEA